MQCMVSIVQIQEMYWVTIWKTYGVLMFATVGVAQVQTLYPRFIEEYKRAALILPKNTPPGTAIFRFRVDDSNRNVPLLFSITGQSHEYFDIKNVTTYDANLILLRPLKQSGDIQLNISIEVEDSIKQKTTIPFRIHPTDADYSTDHVFLDANRTLSYTVPENSPKNKEVGCVLVRSNERPGNTRAPTLELEPDCNTFCVDRVLPYTREDKKINRGCIRLVSELDYEKQNVYYVTLIALNGYQETSLDERNIVSIGVIIIVEDVQDTPPKFIDLPSVVHVTSDALVGKNVLTAHAEDGDVTNPRSISYSLVQDSESQYFQINSNNGEVVLTSNADDISEAIRGDHVVLHIKAEERGEPIANSSTIKDVVVFFDSEENQAPIFARETYEAQVQENAEIFSQIKILDSTEITDNDQGIAGVFTLHLEDEIEGQMVDRILEIQPPVIVRKGAFQIRVKNPDLLNYELHPQLKFKIIAEEISENPKTSSATMTLNIEDINDNAPNFSENPYYAEIPEDAKVGYSVVQITATDADSGRFGEVTYTKIIGELSDMLNLDPKSGLITVANSGHGLDREFQDEYEFEIEASDGGIPPNTNRTRLILRIGDVNDEKPKFKENIYQKDLAPDDVSTCPEAILKVEATDLDKAGSSNSMVEYEIRSGDRGVFKIDKESGEICVQKWPLPPQNELTLLNNGDPKYNYNLEVRAYDKGVPTQENIVNVNINIMKNPEYLNGTILYIFRDSSSNVERDKLRIERFLTKLNGANTIIRDVRPYMDDNAMLIQGRSTADRTLITTFVRYPKQTMVDLEIIARELNITAVEGSSTNPDDYVAAGQVEYGWKVALITLLVILAIVLLILICFCCYRQSQRLDERKVKPTEDKATDSTNNRSQVIEVATLEQGLSAKRNIREELVRGGTKMATKHSRKSGSMSDEDALLANGTSKKHVPPSANGRVDERRMSAGHHLVGGGGTRSQPHVSYSRHLHSGQDSQQSGNHGKSYQDQDIAQVDEVDEIVEEYSAETLPPVVTTNKKPRQTVPPPVPGGSQRAHPPARLGPDYRENFDDEIEEIIVIEPDGHRAQGAPVRRVRRIIKRSPARVAPEYRGAEDGEWVPMQLPEWLGKVPTAEYVEEYEGEELMGDLLGNPRFRRMGGRDGGRRILVKKYKDGGESLPGDRLEFRESQRGSRSLREEEEFLDRLDGRVVGSTRHHSQERPRHRYRGERGRALTRTSFRVDEMDSEDDLIDLETIPDDKYASRGKRGQREVGTRPKERENPLKSRSLGDVTVDDGEADVEDDYEREVFSIKRSKQKRLTKQKRQMELDTETLAESSVALQTTETDSKCTQTQFRAESGRKAQAEKVANVGLDATSVNAGGEFEFVAKGGVPNLGESPAEQGGSNESSPHSGETIASNNSQIKHDKVNELNLNAKNNKLNNKLKTKKGESRYMDWYNNKNGRGDVSKHKANCERLQQQNLTVGSGETVVRSSHEDENIADETKGTSRMRRGSDPMNNQHQQHRRAENVVRRTGDPTLDAMDNEMRLGGNRFVAEEDEDSGIGHTDTFKNSKNKQFIEKKSLFTIAYNGMQNKQDALKDRETSASANNNHRDS